MRRHFISCLCLSILLLVAAAALACRDEIEQAPDEEQEQAAAEEVEEEAEAAVDAPTDEGERSETGTNIQVSGVDEPDVIKTDGEHLYVLDSEQLSIVAITADGLEWRSALVFERSGYLHVLGGQQLLLAGDTLFALRTVGFDENDLVARWDSDARQEWLWWWYEFRGENAFADNFDNQPLTQLVEIDVSDPARPWIRRTLEVEAELLGARLVGASARILLGAATHRVVSEDYAPASRLCEYESAAAYAADECTDRTEGPLVDPQDVHSFSGRGRWAADGLAVLLTFDLGGGAPGLGRWGAVSVLTEGRDVSVYASLRSFYVAQLDGGRTNIYRFDLGEPLSPRLAWAEFARGRLINQFALSEFRGYLRVATTIDDTWPTESAMSVFELSETSLRRVSTLTGLGPAELIHAVRFMGERAFVVTFRQIDPLYVIDLSNPLDPFVAGELKLPGFSRYMHPLGSGRLLAVGQDADPGTGRPLGLQLSLFDVSDSYDPRLLDQLKPAPEHPGPVRGWAEIDHRAFTYEQGVAYVPALLIGGHDWSGVGHVYAVAVSCDELTLLGAFGGEAGAFPVRVLPIGERLYVLSWAADNLLIQQFSPPAPIEVEAEGGLSEEHRIRVLSGSGDRPDASGC